MPIQFDPTCYLHFPHQKQSPRSNACSSLSSTYQTINLDADGRSNPGPLRFQKQKILPFKKECIYQRSAHALIIKKKSLKLLLETTIQCTVTSPTIPSKTTSPLLKSDPARMPPLPLPLTTTMSRPAQLHTLCSFLYPAPSSRTLTSASPRSIHTHTNSYKRKHPCPAKPQQRPFTTSPPTHSRPNPLRRLPPIKIPSMKAAIKQINAKTGLPDDIGLFDSQYPTSHPINPNLREDQTKQCRRYPSHAHRPPKTFSLLQSKTPSSTRILPCSNASQ